MDSVIPPSVPMQQLLALSAPAKMAVVDALCESMEEEGNLPTAWQLEELDRRAAADQQSPEPTFTWDEAQQLVKRSYDQAGPA